MSEENLSTSTVVITEYKRGVYEEALNTYVGKGYKVVNAGIITQPEGLTFLLFWAILVKEV